MNNNKIVSAKRTIAIFLAIVLVTGTIAVMSPSFMTTEEAQAQPYYGMDSYGASDYGNDNRYNSYEPSYGRDNDRKSYDNSYKPQYPSYGKDNRDKSKDIKSIDINKFDCINTNININGNNTGNVSIGNKGQGYSGAYSSDGSGGYSGDDGYSKQGKGFECIINNNNNNTNIVDAGGNVTDSGRDNDTDACEECFRQILNATQFAFLEERLAAGVTIVIGAEFVEVGSLEELCEALADATDFELGYALTFIFATVIDSDTYLDLEECLAEVFGIELSSVPAP